MKDRIILFDGKNLDAFHDRETGKESNWKIDSGVVTVVNHDLVTNEEFGDAHIHVEFRCPFMPWAPGQSKGNSGVYIQGEYEIQILDTSALEEMSTDSCGGIYQTAAPLTNACKAPLEWQTYDIYFRSAKLNEDGSVNEPAVVTVILNGQVVQNNVKLYSNTPGGLKEKPVERGPMYLQDHCHPVSFRNIWIQPLD